MTHLFQYNRKQKRDDSEEFDHFIPSAKRAKLKTTVDNLNQTPLNYPCLPIPNPAMQFPYPAMQFPYPAMQFPSPPKVENQEDRFNPNICQRSIAQYNVARIDCSNVGEEQIQQMHYKYLPDLNASENPHYYENNRLLFELYVERTQRSSCHPNTSHT